MSIAAATTTTRPVRVAGATSQGRAVRVAGTVANCFATARIHGETVEGKAERLLPVTEILSVEAHTGPTDSGHARVCMISPTSGKRYTIILNAFTGKAIACGCCRFLLHCYHKAIAETIYRAWASAKTDGVVYGFLVEEGMPRDPVRILSIGYLLPPVALVPQADDFHAFRCREDVEMFCAEHRIDCVFSRERGVVTLVVGEEATR